MKTQYIAFKPLNDKDRASFLQHCEDCGYHIGDEIYGYDWEILLTYPNTNDLVGGDEAWLEESNYHKFYYCGSNLRLAIQYVCNKCKQINLY